MSQGHDRVKFAPKMHLFDSSMIVMVVDHVVFQNII